MTQEDKELISFWSRCMEKPVSLAAVGAGLSINNARTMGFDQDSLVKAIAGCRLSRWHMGENDKGQVYDSLPMILRNKEQIVKFINIFYDVSKKKEASQYVSAEGFLTYEGWLRTQGDS